MTSNNTDSNLQFLSGGGEMGQLIREKDWSKSILGTPDTWPQSLRTTLGILLNSKFPMFLWWGTDLICFYNDAYRPSLGKDGKHPSILGMKAIDAWPEIWDTIKPLIDQVISTGEATWHEDALIPIYRNNTLEDVYWTFSYSPVFNEKNSIAGVLVTCTETTDKVEVFRQLNDISKKLLSNLMQLPIGVSVLRGKQYIPEMANEAYLELVDKKEAEFLNRPLFESLPEVKGTVQHLLDKVMDTGIPHRGNEVPVPLLRNGKMGTFYFDFVYHPLRDENNEIDGIIVTVTEVTNRATSRKKLEEAEQKVRAVVEHAPFAIAVYTGEEMRVEMANQAIIDIWGKGNDVVGKTFTEILPELADQSVFEQIKEVYRTGKSFHTQNTPLDLVVNGKKGTYYFNYDFTPLYDSSGKVYGVMNTGTDVTEINITKQKIEESDARFRDTVKQAPVGIIILRTKDYIVEMANDAYMQIVNKDVKQFVGKPLFDSIPEAKESTLHLMHQVMDTGEPYRGNEVPVPLKQNGEINIYNFDFVYHPLIEDNGSISGIIVTVTDVTEKVASRKKIERNEEKLKIVIDASELGTWELNLKTREVVYSQRYLEIIGGYKEKSKLTHEQLRKHIHPDDLEVRDESLKQAFATGHLNNKVRVIWNDKSVHWIESKGTVFYNENNEPAKMVGTVRDITTEKMFTEELERQVSERMKELEKVNKSLKQSEERYHLMIEEVQDYAIIYLNRDGIVENWNKGAEKIKGYKADEIIGKSFSTFYPEADQNNKLPQYLQSQATEHGRAHHEGWRVRKDGSLFWASVTITAIHNSKNEVIGFSKVTHDLTAKKEADDKIKLNSEILEQKNRELEKMNKELQSFAYISSHDLQEPLRKIQTFADQIIERESENLTDSGKDKFRRMQNAAHRMQNLINDLLAYSRSNTHDKKMIKTDLVEVIDNIKEDLSEELLQKHATIESDDTKCIVDIIPFQFHQLLFNLVSNSLKFARQDVAPVIKIKYGIQKGKNLNNGKLNPDADYCYITFTDNGIGFEQKYGEKIFEVFQRLHGKEVYEGTGIGLAIVKKIVDNHNGLISASSELGKGATFTIIFPVRDNPRKNA